MNGPLRCSICGRTFNNLPPDAVRLSRRGGAYQMWRFDGAVHNLASVKVGHRKTALPQEKA
jgi:hypothetical protein